MTYYAYCDILCRMCHELAYTLWDLSSGFNNLFNLAAIASPLKLKYKNYLQCQQKWTCKKQHLVSWVELLKLKDMYHLEIAKFVQFYQHNKLPNLYNQYFTSTKTVHKYNTKYMSYRKIYLHVINSNAAKQALQFNGAQIWIFCSEIGKIFLFQILKKQLKPIYS